MTPDERYRLAYLRGWLAIHARPSRDDGIRMGGEAIMAVQAEIAELERKERGEPRMTK